MHALKPKAPAPAALVRSRLNADQSARFLARKIRDRQPFFYLRYGDGAIECMAGEPGKTCDGEQYSFALGAELADAWYKVVRDPRVLLGDWQAASFDARSEYARYVERWEHLAAPRESLIPGAWLHPEALLLMRESATLVDFYRAVKSDLRRKLYMGPAAHAPAAKMLGAEFLETPLHNLFAFTEAFTAQLARREFDVLLFGAGLAGVIPVVRCWERHPERTYVHLGSAMDPLFRGQTRQQQIRPDRARRLFRGLL